MGRESGLFTEGSQRVGVPAGNRHRRPPLRHGNGFRAAGSSTARTCSIKRLKAAPLSRAGPGGIDPACLPDTCDANELGPSLH
ncbi:hypothetical protein SKAU_G00047650 [Synaphobranchus kaupii]|uniref:Uncharacterized protein n=1 Tax=Synaphobranchus kaupii TaxID=118154 RepID=A0A9Q1G2I7_SYNKA|nr:hypothetical protein SKAU_G00047650 [Synaphobranchus kaupii]